MLEVVAAGRLLVPAALAATVTLKTQTERKFFMLAAELVDTPPSQPYQTLLEELFLLVMGVVLVVLVAVVPPGVRMQVVVAVLAVTLALAAMVKDLTLQVMLDLVAAAGAAAQAAQVMLQVLEVA